VEREGDRTKVVAPPHHKHWGGYVEVADLSFGDTADQREENARVIAAAPQVRMLAAALIREIEKRDGEGNTIPAHLYSTLKRLVLP
jgi:hypothetical protein